MCGLVSVISKNKSGLFHGDLKIFTEMLFADQLRGSDGTGIFYNDKLSTKILKGPVASSDFVNTDLYDKATLAAIQRGNFVVGHNRAATKGKLTYANTHPFSEKHITLVHNGTLVSHKNLADVEVDSHAICLSIAQQGIEKTVKAINGAYALIWYDAKQKTLNFLRNSQRPLWCVETDSLFIFVSEAGLAQWICSRNREKVTSITEVPVNTMITFESGSWDTYTTKTVLPYTPQPTGYWTPPKQVPAVTTGPAIGSSIKFIPVEIDPAYPDKLVGEWEDTNSGELVEVRFWATNKEQANKLLKSDTLQGTISHIAYNSVEKSRFFILKNVYDYQPSTKESKKEVVATSFNKRKLTQEDINNLQSNCTMCGGAIGKMYHACNITQGTGKMLNGTCPDCTEWIYRESQQGYTY